ncbi:leucine zipper protein 1 [Hyperolius riggenbachi]|uniref:leucine zipper protein 1 n=1 Tax=Hyperolius riggenbachi TaxID=752182 RepID=UPI0035A2E621
MEHSSRHLRFKLQSLGRRLDDLEEATRNLQKAEEEVLDLQDKIIQAEGSNSSMLADVEALRKRVTKIEGKDEEVKKAEDLGRLIKEQLENEENITRELRLEIEQLQKRMSELEKLEEVFNKSKSDCTQLGLSLNEEKNMSKKLSSELELLRTKVKELESSESKLDKTEQLISSELEKIKSLSLSFANERKRFIERDKLNEKTILELRERLDLQKKETGEQTRNESNLLERSSNQHGEHNFRIEDTLTSKPSQRAGLDYIKESEIQTSSKNEKNKHQEDNKIKELNQEIEKLKNQLKRFEGLEQELKQLKEKNCELKESFLGEQNKNKQLNDELQTLKNQVSPFKEVENGVLDSDDMSHSRIKNERTKNKVTELPISKYSSRDVSPQHVRSDRVRNSESLYKRQLSNSSSSSSRKSTRSQLSDITTGNLRKQEDKSSYFPSSKDYGSTQNYFKKSKDQPSVLSRYPPASQEQSPQKPWKSSSKQAERSMALFGEDYSGKAYSKKEISTENEENKERPTDDSSEILVATKIHEEMVPFENCSVSTAPSLDPVNQSQDITNAQENGNKMENELKSPVNLDDAEILKPTGRERLFKFSSTSRKDDLITNNNEQTSKSPISNKEEMDPQNIQMSSTQRSYYSRDKVRSRSSKPIIPEKPQILENSDYRETERRVRMTGVHSKRQSSPREKNAYENLRMSSFENHSPPSSLQSEVAVETFRKTSTSSDGLESTEANSYTAIRTRSCSPRESLQSTLVIKPIINEKDVKESMSEYRARSGSETSKHQVNTTPNKVTSSITIYPSETASSRSNLEETPRERHTSTSNIRLSANDQPLLKNNISIPYEISINKEDMVLKVANTDKALDHKEYSKTSDRKLREQIKDIDNDLGVETISWKKHSLIETNNLDRKPRSDRSTWMKSLSGSSEELDRIDRRLNERKSRRKSCFDEEKSSRLRNHELYPRNKSSDLGSWSTSSEFLSKRSQSSLSASEIVSRRSTALDLTSRYSWRSPSFEVDDLLSSRRKYSDRLGRTDTSGWKQPTKHRSMVEERIRQLEN